MALAPIKIKKGATFEVGVEFTQEEWDALYPWTSVEADVKRKGEMNADTEIVVEADARTVRIIAETDTWPVGATSMDIRIVKGNKIYLIPTDGVISIIVLETVTLGETS